MLKNKIIGRKIRNIIILFMAIIVMIGAYKFIDRSKAEKVVEIDTTVIDNYGYLANEEIKLEAKQLEEDNYEVELPESINTKKILQVINVTLKNISESNEKPNIENEIEDVEIIENRIYLTKEQVENTKVQMDVIYDIAILEKNEQEQYNKILLSEKSEEERKSLEAIEGTEKLYQKILKYEDVENNKLVEVRGFLPIDAKLKVEELTQEQIKSIFGDKKIDVAYDIKIIVDVITQIPADEANPDAEPEEIIETIEINPEEFGETCQVTIKDANIVENSQVYHVKEDNTYEKVNVKDNTEENISFEAPSFSVYAVSSEEDIMPVGILSNRVIGSPAAGTYTQESLTVTVKISETISGYNYGDSPSVSDSTSWAMYMGDGEFQTTFYAPTTGMYIYLLGVSGQVYVCGPYTVKSTASKPTISVVGAETWINGAKKFTVSWENADYWYWKYTTSSYWTKGTSNTATFNDEQDTQVQFRAYSESSGLYSDTVTKSIKIDKTAPNAATLTTKLGSSSGNNYTNNTWTNQSVYIALSGGTDVVKTGSVNGESVSSGVYSSTYSITKGGSSYKTGQTSSMTLTDTGTYVITVTTKDNAGNSATNSYTVKIDKTKPTYTSFWSSVGNNDVMYTNKSSVTMYLSGVADADSGLKKVSLNAWHVTTSDSWVKGSIEKSATWDSTNSRYYSTFNFSEIPDTNTESTNQGEGRYIFDGHIFDNADNKCVTSPKRIVIYDTTKPTAATLSMKQGSSSGSSYTNNTWTNQSVYIALNSDESDPTSGGVSSGVASTTYSITKDGASYKTNQTSANTLTETGTYVVTITTKDKAGNSSTRSYTIKIDKIAPTLSSLNNSSNGNWTNQNVTVSPSYIDAHSGVAKIQYSYDQSTWYEDWNSAISQSGTTYSATDTWSAERNNAVYVRAIDNAGNTSTISGPTYVRIDKTNPIISLSTTSCDWRKIALSTTITATDPTSNGVSSGLSSSNSYQYYLSNSSSALSGGSWTTYTSGTTISLNPGTSGTYYLFVKRIKDNAGNTSTSRGTTTTISGTTYQRFGAFKFDYTAPTYSSFYTDTVCTNKSSFTAYVNAPADAHSGLREVILNAWNGSFVEYYKAGDISYDSTNNRYYSTFNFADLPNSSTNATNQGDGYYWVNGYVYDNVGNYVKASSIQVIYDTTAPVWSISNINKDATNNQITATITGDDTLSGVASSSLTASKITVYVDGVAVSSIVKTLGEATWDSGKVTYTLTLSNIAETLRQTGKEYLEYSGTIQIAIAAGTLTDKAGNTSANKKLSYGYTDFIKPDIQYKHQSLDISKTNKTYTMTFEVTDKYYTSGILTLDDLTIKMQNGKVDSSGNAIIYNLKNEPVTLTLRSEEITVSSFKMTNTSGSIATVRNQVIGHRYYLTISNLDQLEKKAGLTTVDYSGIVTVAIPKDKIVDRNGNKNNATTITSGVDIPSGTSSEPAVIDVVNPVWEKESSSANAMSQTATMIINGTDTYFKNSTLTINDIVVYVNGVEIENESAYGITKTLSSSTTLTETRLVNGTNTTVQYGVRYTVTVKGFPKNASQVKIRIKSGTLEDQYGNKNSVSELIMYNCLKPTYTEKTSSSGFLGYSGIAREDIQKVVFVNEISGSKASGATVWDASAVGDNSILAWTSNTSAPYTVYIGSKWEMFANQNSAYLFAYIGYGRNCTSTTTISNLNILNTNYITNMQGMFWFHGYRAMTSLDISSLNTTYVTNMREMFSGCGYTAMTLFSLGNNFDTENVTDMSWMFASFGYTKLNSLSLGEKFNTANVKNMEYMFEECGYAAMSSFSLGSNFDTSKVTNMSHMFDKFGYTKITSLSLGDEFDTGKVTDMSYMFYNCGAYAMTSIMLGEKFDTKNVTNMAWMFAGCGGRELTSLDLGDKFDTNNVTDMSGMFDSCGARMMECLDLGPMFTKITVSNNDMFNAGGGRLIYAPEAIYKDYNTFKTWNEDTSGYGDDLIVGEDGPWIIPIYRPTWSVTGTTVDTTNKSLKINLKGSASYTQTLDDGKLKINYSSNVTSTLSAEDIEIWIDEVQLIDIAASISDATTSGKDITQTITLTNFEEAFRRIGKSYKEWSGNITLKIGGRGESTSTYTANVLTDEYGNQNMMEIDITGLTLYDFKTGDWTEVVYKDETTSSKNQNDKLFADFIKPEFTYTYLETDIDYTLKTAKIVFSVTDKYYASTNANLSVEDLTIKIDGENIDWSKATREFTEIKEITGTVDGATRVIGKEYTLLISNLEQTSIASNQKYADYSGIITVVIPAGKVADESGNTNAATTITMGVGMPGNTLDSVEGTTPYIPEGYSYVEGSVDTGLTIQDGNGNQYVWVEVPRTTTVYPTAGLSITSFTDAEYTKIENDLHTYTSVYRNGTTYTDTWSSEEATGLTETEYNTLKKKMLKSIYKNGGFYVGKYETGIDYDEGPRTSSGDTTQTPVIKQNAYVYNYVTNAQAQNLASSMASGNYTSSLMFGVQWDLVLKFMETKGATQAELMDDSTEWGNYYNNLWTVSNTAAKYSTDSGNSYTLAPYTKKSRVTVLLTTGASDEFSKSGIYDLAGNVWEWSLEYTSNSSDPCSNRGGYCWHYGNLYSANYRYSYDTSKLQQGIGFRVALFADTDQTSSSEAPVVTDVVDPIWEFENLQINKEEQKVTIDIIATDKFFKESTVTTDDIKIYNTGSTRTELTGITKSLSEPVVLTETRNGETVQYGVKYTLTLTDWEEATKQAGKKYKEWSGSTTIQIASGTAEDKYGNTSKEKEVQIGTIDVIKPQITYQYVEGDIDLTGKTVKVVFSVIDKYFKTSTLSVEDLTILVDGETPDWTKVTRTFTSITDITDTVDGTSKVVGKQYTLLLSGLDQTEMTFGKEYLDYSGVVTVAIPAGKITDNDGNTNNATTITMGVDILDDGSTSGEAVIADVVDPMWSLVSASLDDSTIKIKVTDKFFDTSTLTATNLKILANGEETAISKTITNTVDITDLVNGVPKVIGKEYTIKLSNFTTSNVEYTTFVPTNLTTDKLNNNAGFKYRSDNGGDITVVIPAGVARDTSGNTNKEQSFEIGQIDSTKLEIFDVQKITDASAKTETFIFNVTDKNYDSTDLITTDEITIWVDGQEADNITKALSSKAIKANINGTERIVGHQYTLVLSNMVESVVQSGKTYLEWSGTVQVKINADAAKDLSGNTINTETTTISEFVDFIKPQITYTHQSSDIDHGNKKYTMTFEVVDKYYSSGEITLNDLTIKMKNGQKDSSGNEIVYDLKQEAANGKVNITLSKANKTATFNKTVSGAITSGTYAIGHTYTLTISNLEQLEIEDGKTTADYSGIVTVAVAAGKISDTSGNTNDATTITSGIDIPGGTGTGTPVDVVDPLWTKVSSSASAIDPSNKASSTATITFRGTDTYFDQDNFSVNNLKVIVNGAEVTSGITKTLVSTTNLTEERIENGVAKTGVKYGVEYTVTIKGFAQDANQVKIRIPKGVLVDKYGNDSEETDMIVYNVLKSISNGINKGNIATSAFLGESVATTIYPAGTTSLTPIERQNIEKVIFTNDISASTATGVQRVWDVSAQGDGSIIAWTSNTITPYTVYIGSEDEIFANQNSSYLFSYIGFSSACTATTVIENMELLNVNSVTNMEGIFYETGNKTMTSLKLGSKFDTSNVTNMKDMFEGCGQKAMTILDLGDKFDTSNVTNMENMFSSCGEYAITSLDLGDKFDTSNVTNMKFMFRQLGFGSPLASLDLGDKFDTSNVIDMSYMFYNCGYKSLTRLDLGDKFDTSNVTNMASMFCQLGFSKMTSLDLGDKFDTSNVANMKDMFVACGNKVMTSLDLGDKFDTTNVTNMDNMFKNCGSTSMTTLDLGPVFTKIAETNTDMFLNTGKSGCTIYAPESIYKNKNAFKLSSTNTTGSISYTRGTIVPIYKPEWTKQSSTFDATNKTLSVTVKGSAYENKVIDSNVTINYASNVTSTLAKEDIKVYVNGVEVTSTVNPTITVNAGTTSTNSTTGKTEIAHTITLSNLEEAARRAGLPYKELSGNISIKIAGRGEATSTYTANVLKDEYGNQSMMETDESGTWINVTFEDTETNKNTNNVMFADFVKPEFTYESANTTIGSGPEGNKKVSVVFDVVDKYFDKITGTFTADNITVKVSNDEVNTTVNVTKTLTKKNDIIINTTTNAVSYQASGYTVQTNERKIGERYELLVEGLEQLDENGISNGYTYSGPMSISFKQGQVQDKSGNVNDATTITIGVDETDGNPNTDVSPDGTIVDVVDPTWELVDADIENKIVKLRVKDKYFTNSTLTTESIKVLVNGATSTIIVKEITDTTDITDTVDGVQKVVGKEYTIKLSNFTTSKVEYTTFVPTNLTTDNLNNSVGFKYRTGNGGAVSLVIPKGIATDASGNTNKEQSFEIGQIDETDLELYDVQKITDINAKTATFIFNVTDKNYDPTDFITPEEIAIWVDDQKVDSITKNISSKVIKAVVDGNETIVGHQYTLVLSNIVEATLQSGKSYFEWSGTIRVKVNADASKDLRGNILDENTTTLKEFVDLIKPQITYTHQSSDIDNGNKKYTMTFEATDKYYSSGEITLNDLTIKMKNGQKDSSGNEIVYDLKQEAANGKVNITLSKANKTATFNKTVSGAITSGTYVIGHTYTLTISNLEQLEIEDGKTTADYSGIVTVAVAAGKISDTSGNTNDATTITSGIDIPGGTGTGTPVDVVDPLWTKVSSSAYAIDPANKTSSTATIVFRGTDTYFDQNNFSIDNLKVIVNGAEVTSGITKTLDSTTNLTEERIENGTTKTGVKYGVEYTVTIKGFAQDANQVKIRIPKGVLLDKYGNDSEETDLIVYNVLKSASGEAIATKAFLGESVATTIYPAGITSLTPIERQNIEKVIFTNNISGSTATGVQRVWDVSAQGDKSIIAWTSNTTSPYTVYIGSKDEISLNRNSNNLFAYVGSGSACTSTTLIENIGLVNTSGVTTMYQMFFNAGCTAATTLDLGDNFDTSNVTSMNSMFYKFGLNALKTIDLGSKFDTTNVTDMQLMFYKLGYNATQFTTLSLGNKFDTRNVTNMSQMFTLCGYQGMTTLNLGNKFDTSKVTNMSSMFSECGYMALTSLDLGDKFNTSNVTNMGSMFNKCGYMSLTSLELGDNFDTSNVTDMNAMFLSCGYKKLTKLNLGDKFDTSKVTNMNRMFRSFAYRLESLDLGDKFDTSNVTDMTKMFEECGNGAMTTLDLGPAFTKIASEHTNFMTNCGKSNLVIYAAEKIYYNKNTFKLGN